MGKSIIKNYIYNNVLLVFNLIYPFFTMVYVNKIFSLETIGEISFALSIITIFISLSSLGIPVYGMREIAINRENSKKVSKIFSELLILNFISTIIFCIIYFLIVYFYLKNNKNIQIYLILSINLLLNSFLLEWFYTGLEEYEYITKRSILVKIISFIFMIFFIKTEKDINLYLIFLVLGTSLNGIFNICNSKKYAKFSLVKINLKTKMQGLKYFYFQGIIGIFYNGCDQIILGLQSTSAQIAYYARCKQLISVPGAITSAFTKTLIPRINNNINNETEYKKLVKLSFNFACLLSFPILAGILFLSENMLYIIGGYKFLPAKNILRVTSFLLIASFLAVFLDTNISVPHRKEKNTLYGNIVVMFSSVILALIFVKKYGALGSIFSVVIGESLGVLTQLFFIKKQEIYFKFFDKNIFKYILASMVMGVELFLIKFLHFSYILEFLICLITGGVVYFFVLLLLKEYFLMEGLKIILKKFRREKI